MTSPAIAITIRAADADDHFAVARLAALDSAENLPPMPLLLAEVDDELRVALSLRNRSAIADPFFPTADILALLQAYAAELDRPPRRRPRTTPTRKDGSMSPITTKSRAGRIVGRATQIWAELDYAQRRLLEIRTGTPQLTRQQRRTAGSLSEPEALYALEQRE